MLALLVGNPNCGKTTLFNALTGERQRVGNWPGVTVEKKSGQVMLPLQQTMELIDLPGIYALTQGKCDASQDEKITVQTVMNLDADLIINVIDACHLERHLYLTSQLLELQKPMIIVLTMLDLAKASGIDIDIKTLQATLQCPVVVVHAHKNLGITALKQTAGRVPVSMKLAYPEDVSHALQTLEQHYSNTPYAAYMAKRTLEADAEMDMTMADVRYTAIHRLVKQVQFKRADASPNLTSKIDKVVLHRFWALPIFLLTMYTMFWLAINIGGFFQNFFDTATNGLFVQGPTWILQGLHSPSWLVALLANGLGRGLNTTLTFIPVITLMYFFLSLLEASGYMARAAFVIDRIMRWLGLPGKAFVPMIVSFGCNVPGIMAARTLDKESDRLLTVLMSPFMSCSARLAIYAVFVAAFFPTGGQNIVFSLYIIGILMAVLTGYLLRKTLFKGHASPLILELPAYHRPSLLRIAKETGLRLHYFLIRAGKFIVPICAALGLLNNISIDGGVLAYLGKSITPLFSPMGIGADNWPATVGLLTGTLAKEVVIGTLNSLYAPLSLYGAMVQKFDGHAGAYAYLLFILLYIPCISTMAVIKQEASKGLMWFSIGWSLLLAYTVSVGFYQLATIAHHPLQSLVWLLSCGGAIFLAIQGLKWYAPKQKDLFKPCEEKQACASPCGGCKFKKTI